MTEKQHEDGLARASSQGVLVFREVRFETHCSKLKAACFSLHFFHELQTFLMATSFKLPFQLDPWLKKHML
jgi:hypothetical protein